MSLNLKNSHKKKECLRLNHESQEEDEKMKFPLQKKNRLNVRTSKAPRQKPRGKIEWVQMYYEFEYIPNRKTKQKMSDNPKMCTKN